MRVVYEINTFEQLYSSCWAGALTVLDEIQLAGKTEELMTYLDSVFDYDDNIPSATQVNDYIWFECEEIYEVLGMNN